MATLNQDIGMALAYWHTDRGGEDGVSNGSYLIGHSLFLDNAMKSSGFYRHLNIK